MIAIIADDLSGACDTAIKLSNNGLKAKVLRYSANEFLNDDLYDAVAFNTNTRSLSEQEAYNRTSLLAYELKKQGIQTVYKKIDSIMRGNIAAEVAAVEQVMQSDLVIYAPAVPQCNRIVINGRLIVQGEKNIGIEIKDRLTPIQKESSAIIPLQIIYEGAVKIKVAIQQAYVTGKKHILLDADTDEGLDNIAQACLDLPYKMLFVGAAGFMGALSKIWMHSDRHSGGQQPTKLPVTNKKNVLMVVGTRHYVSCKQMEYLLKQPNIACVSINPYECVKGNGREQEKLALVQAEKAISENTRIVLLNVDAQECEHLLIGKGNNGENSVEAIAECLASVSKQLVEKYHFDIIFACGGDTANDVFSHVGIQEIELITEYEPGIPVGIAHLSNKRNVIVATKSGGYGGDDAMYGLCKYLWNIA